MRMPVIAPVLLRGAQAEIGGKVDDALCDTCVALDEALRLAMRLCQEEEIARFEGIGRDESMRVGPASGAGWVDAMDVLACL